MNFKQLTNASRVDKLMFTQTTILHLVPEFNKKVSQMLFKSGLRLTNCSSLITKSKSVKMGAKTFHTRKLYLNTKLALTADPDKPKLIPVLQKLPSKIEQGKILLIDHSIISQGTLYTKNLTNEKNALTFMLNQLKDEFQKSKQTFPAVENVIIFLFGPGRKEESILDLLIRMQVMDATILESNLKIFDKYILSSVNIDNENSRLFPIVGFNKTGKINIIKPNIQHLRKLLEIDPISIELHTEEPPITDSSISKSKKLKQIADVGKTITKKVDQEANTYFEINDKQLRKVLRQLKVDDRTTANNIKIAINSYVKNQKVAIKESELQKVTLKAINQTIFNTDKINEQYLDNPAKLISKLKEVNSYQQKIIYSEPKTLHLISPKVIDLDKVTGLVRQKYEFSDNIHKTINTLFKSLETQNNNPIKVTKIKHEFQDNNLDRVIKYTITLQNLSGGFNKPYDVVIKIPALVNDRYFKLNGKNYIMSNQQFFVPITKTDPNECRLLTNFATITLSVVNMKYNISELPEIIEYVKRTYPEIIQEVRKEGNKIISVDLIDNITINLYDNDAYLSPMETLSYDNNESKWVVKNIEKNTFNDLQTGKAEFIFNKISKLLTTINPDEKFQKTPRSIPYIQFYLGGVKFPLIIYLWQQMGLINALIKLGIDNDISAVDKYIRQKKDVILPLKDDMILVIHPQNKREQLIVNGLVVISDLRKMKFSKDEINKQETIESFITTKYGSRALYNLNHVTNNIIDPITKQILEFQDKPTNVIDLISQEMVQKLLNDKADSLSDLKIYRQRQAEVMFELMYKALTMAHNTYKNEVTMGNENAKAFLSRNYVIDCLLGIHQNTKGNNVLELSEPINAIAELKQASKLIKMGPGGIPTRRSFKAAHRNLHPSNYGNVGANSTTEYADVGTVNHTTLTPILTNKYGNYGMKDITDINGWEIVSLEEALTPFINEMDSSRAILAYTHKAQSVPILNGDEPLVATGAEYVIPQLASPRFLHKAKRDGKVLEVEKDKYIKVKYDNNVVEYLNTTQRISSTKRASYLALSLDTLQLGDKFKTNDIIAWTKMFNKDNCYISGKNLKIAIMNYLGYSHEDGYVISEKTSENDFNVETLEEVSCIVPLNTKLLNVNSKLNSQTKENDALMEFTYMGDLEEYIDAFSLIDSVSSEEELISYTYQNNKIQLRSPGGKLKAIKIFVNNQNQTDSSILKFWKDVCDDLKNRQKLYSLGKKTNEEKLKALDNLDMSMLRTGTHKYHGKLFEGARISFFIKKTNAIRSGDKISNRFGSKGVVSHIVKSDKTPYAQSLGNIDVFIAPSGVLGRKNMVILKELYLGKIFYLLPDILSAKAKNSRIKTTTIINLIRNVYENLDTGKITDVVKKKLTDIQPTKLRKLLISKEFKLNFIIQPFTNISFDKIKDVATLLDIKLDEKVFIPELNTWTKREVPVGVQYFNRMEQTALDYETLRSTGSYAAVTGQPQKGRTDYSGQAIGNMDIYNLMTYDTPQILEELLTMRSDDFESKREMQINIIQHGSTDMPKRSGKGGRTQLLKRTYMTALGLKTSEVA